MMHLHGRVSREDGTVQVGWRVQVVRQDGAVADEVPVGTQGQYHFHPLPMGVYRLQIVGEHGRALSLSSASQNQVRPELTLLTAARPREHHLVVREVDEAPLFIQSGGQITGVVTAADTALPLSSIYVQAYTVDGNFSASDFTNSQGQYALTGLADAIWGID